MGPSHLESEDNMEVDCSSTPSPLPQQPETETKHMEEAANELLQEVKRLCELGEKCAAKDTFSSCVRRLTCRLQNVRNPNQALTTLLSLSARASSSVRRGGRINVQPTSTSRRRSGVSKGSRRIPSGRPPKQPAGTKIKPPKRLHKLSLSIKQNKSHPKAHGR